MARPVVIDDDLILKTARDVFLEKGLRATTAEIAERAGVSQGILFKRFKTKQALFRASMNADEDPAKPLPINLQERVGVGSVEQTLKDLGNMLVQKFLAVVPTMMMDWSSREESSNPNGASQDTPCDGGPERAARGIRVIAEYLGEEQRLGRLRVANVEILAQMFVGSIWHYAFLQVTMGEVHQQPLTQEEFVDGVVQTLWSGVAPLC